ncbi:hypothetical protein [Dyella sp. ASV21]|uniref:hypothetical protein n=1 Tax=Dyella sp. ASV21 TaxID=2795114 RepID=UPI0018EC3FA7|nr:hypothetical protein [Dyella sp. ASV21]
MAADIELSGRIAAMRSHSEAAGLLGQVSLEAAYATCAIVLLDAAVEDGVELDLDTLGDAFGVSL